MTSALAARPHDRVIAWDDPAFRANYLIVGAQKAGTTALNAYLAGHPEVCAARFGEAAPAGRPQEVHFFDDERFFPPGRPPVYAYYHLFFRHYRGERAIGETTPTYMYLPHVAPRLRAYNPDLRLLFVLRNPVDRAWSHYSMVRNVIGQESLPFSLAVRLEPLRTRWSRRPRLGDASADNTRRMVRSARHAYLGRGFYMRQIRQLLRHFRREQMLFLRSEDLQQRPAETLAEVFAFLGLEAVPIRKAEGFTGDYRPLSPRLRRLLVRTFSPEIDELERFLGWDLSAWRKV